MKFFLWRNGFGGWNRYTEPLNILFLCLSISLLVFAIIDIAGPAVRVCTTIAAVAAGKLKKTESGTGDRSPSHFL